MLFGDQPSQKVPDVPTSHTLYAVLGFLDEHFGRTIAKDADVVEHFWVNESQKADLFEKYLNRLVKEYHLQTSLRREVSEGHTYFVSTELAQFINSFYLKHYLTGTDSDGNPAYTTGRSIFQQNTGQISAVAFPPGDREAKIAYLIGAHQRYAEQNIFQIVNAYPKAQLIYQFLKELGSPQVVFVYPDPDRAPCRLRVAFEPTQELIERLCLDAFSDRVT
ncbi:MAG: hypothetical protein F6K32_09305 [Desertifilum sp. SIO1I2]|nr:hypothetical protein [Desertifilum sp. SIO1I2]